MSQAHSLWLEPLQDDLYLPDGKYVHITHSGSLQLTKDIILSDVLCVFDFNCNLISVVKLISHASLALVFSVNTCILQDYTLKKGREIGSLQDGFYKFTVPNLFQGNFFVVSSSSSVSNSINEQFPNMCNTVIHTDANIWHSRLGHPSTFILLLLF